RMLSSMTPTIVLDSAGAPWLITGASGGGRIITGVTQIMLNVIDYQMPLGQAESAPRFHTQAYPGILELESGGFDSTLVRALTDAGQRPAFPKSQDFAWVQSILRVGSSWQGVSEPRGNGLAAGY